MESPRLKFIRQNWIGLDWGNRIEGEVVATMKRRVRQRMKKLNPVVRWTDPRVLVAGVASVLCTNRFMDNMDEYRLLRRELNNMNKVIKKFTDINPENEQLYIRAVGGDRDEMAARLKTYKWTGKIVGFLDDPVPSLLAFFTRN